MVFSFGSFLFLAEEVAVAAVTEVSIKAAVGIIVGDDISASLTGGEALFCAVRAVIQVGGFVISRFGFWQRFAAVFTSYIHDCFRLKFVELPNIIKADEVEDVE